MVWTLVCDPGRGRREDGPVVRPPVGAAERRNVNAARGSDEYQPAYQSRVSQRDADRNDPAHRLGDEIARAVDVLLDQPGAVVESSH